MASRGSRPERTHGSRTQRAGFTLIELMIVIAIMGVLATLAGIGVRKYILEAKKAEAGSMLTQIRTGEEAYKDEMFRYHGLNNFQSWHPVNEPGGMKYGWDSANGPMRPILDDLAVVPNGPVEFSYAVVAGDASVGTPPLPLTDPVNIPAPTGPWYIAMAKGDLDDDGNFVYAITYSGTAVVHIENTY